MRRRRGIIGYIYGFISIIIIGGLLLAVLKQFNGDIFAAISWFFTWVMSLISDLANKFSNSDSFNKIFK